MVKRLANFAMYGTPFGGLPAFTVLAFAAAASPLFAANCAQQARPDSSPWWTPIVTAQSAGTYYKFQDGSETIERSASLPAYSVFDFPASPEGSISSEIFPSGPPWAFNGGVANSVCSGPGDADCTGKRIWRYAGSLLQSKPLNGVNGLRFVGSFTGRMTSFDDGVALYQTVFFHQSKAYWGQAEYGLYYDGAQGIDEHGVRHNSRLVFYWSSNSNCGSNPFCRSEQLGGAPMYEDGAGSSGVAPPPNTRIHGCTVPIPDASTPYAYEVWIFQDHDGAWKFRVEVIDPYTFGEVIPGMTVDPNSDADSAWFPIATLTRDAGPGYGNGYITSGVVRYDPHASMKYASPPRMIIESLAVGRYQAFR
jgi:hypothetical protein